MEKENVLKDKFQRQIKYLRLAVTDRCNLRCTYCMPEHMQFVKKNQLLSFEEMLKVVEILAENGVEKVRITGGEPFVRNGLMDFLTKLVKIEGIKKVGITTNGVLLDKYLDQLKEIGVTSVNLSLDATSKDKFFEITRRDDFDKVYAALERMVALNFDVKINMVVMEGKNTEEIIPLANYAKRFPIEVRYIEEMPFNGKGKEVSKSWNHIEIENELKKGFPDLTSIDTTKSNTAQLFNSNQMIGRVGIIPAFTRSFCGSCDRLRLTSLGEIRNCLYAKSGLNLKQALRENISDAEILELIQSHLSTKKKSGWEEEKENTDQLDSMSLIGG
ncbi:GTP 3',8-cyclase MoaA [Flammeovirga kamogawensis]|uniref:GTP 3',8-cyclase n=1 Tax=Flammeovirga kamogawensis TaxID=373891 RepID=A0ABX8GVZ6_9BACT|nr:GTP 3',8-cyclase MoaA [Flammeovirga kamogawensis]MBB6464047.1 cyclic pyranopterin phosphate synthase [Flammeovirga kamogawensis]QWG07377.1 GTP 3',8-cyclase MoaA [Flammeovirga kamogawensis]TRX69192.1 GTP 3',8-cyclase MoaA [Flammeovirga kamogawensis]